VAEAVAVRITLALKGYAERFLNDRHTVLEHYYGLFGGGVEVERSRVGILDLPLWKKRLGSGD
jgi:hypothetical protein